MFRAHVLRVLPRASFRNFDRIGFRLRTATIRSRFDTIAGAEDGRSHVPHEDKKVHFKIYSDWTLKTAAPSFFFVSEKSLG